MSSARVQSFPELYNASNWKIKSEGNANIVLSFVGKNDKFRNIVLRVRKTSTDNDINVASITNNNIDQSYTNSFINIVMKPLLGEDYISNSILLEVSKEFLKDLSKTIFSSRSYKRTHKDIDLNQRYATLTLDITTFISKTITPTLSVELKPKCGFLPTSSFINFENSVKFQSCRFCMHKWLKFHEKLEKEIEVGVSNNDGDLSGYCPLDLFSLDKKRSRKAITELLICPSNNLKLFIEGVNVPIEHSGLQEHLKRFFNINSSTNNNMDDEQKAKDLFITLLSNAVNKEQALFEHIKYLQKSLDEFDIEGLYQLYLEHQTNLLEPTLEEWNEIVQGYINRTKKTELNKPNSIVGFTVEQVRQRVYEFLISITLKDCSIMFTFRKLSNNDDFIVEDSVFGSILQERIKKVSILDNNDNGNYYKNHQQQQQQQQSYYDFKVHVIDLDPKSITKIPYYHQLDNKIVRNFLTKCIAKNNCIE